MKTTLASDGNTVRYGSAYGLTVSESRFPSRLAIAEHTHATGFLSLPLSGSVADTIVSRETNATPGYCCYVPADTPHANTFGAAGARCFLVEIDGPALPLLDRAGYDVVTPWCGFGGPSEWRSLSLYRLVRQNAATSLDFEEFVLHAFEGRPQMPKRSRPPAWLSRTREHLDAQIDRPPSLGILAAEADVHPMHLVRAFRMHVGCSPGEFVQTRRIAHSCALLLDTELPLARIALHLGYHDQSHFTRAFKTRVGVPPGAYRNAD